MLRRIVFTVVLVVLTAAGGRFAGAQDENYDGEGYCRYAPAWPGGTYLGQMHPFHSKFYRGYAERRGWDPCTTWANDQRDSAVRGLRELGYTVTEPAPRPAPAPQVGAPASVGYIDPDLIPLFEVYVTLMLILADQMPPQDAALFRGFIDGPRITTLRIVFAPIPEPVHARYFPGTHTVEIAERLRHEHPGALIALIAHEIVHAVAVPTTSVEECYGWEVLAFTAQAVLWIMTGGYPGMDTDLERWNTYVVDNVEGAEFARLIENIYHPYCAWAA